MARLDGGVPGPLTGTYSRKQGGTAIRLVVAGDQDMVRSGSAALLSAQSDIDIAGEAANGRPGVEVSRRTIAALLGLGRLTHRFEAPQAGIRGPRRAAVAASAGVFACYAPTNV